MENKRLIDANALSDSKWWESLTDDFDKARARIIVMSAPTVDAVEVVRGKDCKGWCSEEIAKRYGVDRYCTMTMILTGADDFCSQGERKDNERKASDKR